MNHTSHSRSRTIHRSRARYSIAPPVPPKPATLPRYRYPNTSSRRVSPTAASFVTTYSDPIHLTPYPFPSHVGSYDDFGRRRPIQVTPHPRVRAPSSVSNPVRGRADSGSSSEHNHRKVCHRFRRAVVGVWKRITTALRGTTADSDSEASIGFTMVQCAPSAIDVRSRDW